MVYFIKKNAYFFSSFCFLAVSFWRKCKQIGSLCIFPLAVHFCFDSETYCSWFAECVPVLFQYTLHIMHVNWIVANNRLASIHNFVYNTHTHTNIDTKPLIVSHFDIRITQTSMQTNSLNNHGLLMRIYENRLDAETTAASHIEFKLNSLTRVCVGCEPERERESDSDISIPARCPFRERKIMISHRIYDVNHWSKYTWLTCGEHHIFRREKL